MIINFLLIVTNILNIIIEFFNKSTAILLWTILLIIFTFPHILTYNTGEFYNSTLNGAGLFAVLINLIYLITRVFLNKKVNIDFKGKLINNDKIFQEKKAYENIFFLLYVISILIIVYGIISRGFTLFNYTWSDGMSYRKNIIERIASFIIIAFSGIGLITFIKKDKLKFCIILIVYILYVLISRSRYNIVPFIIPFLIYYVYSGNIKKVIKSLILGVLILFSVFLLQQIRYAGSLNNLINNYTISDIVNNTFSFIREGKGEFGLSKVFYYFVENNNNFNNFGEGRTYIRLMLLPFPSSIFVFKPRDFAMDMWEAWHGVITNIGTMHPTLYGDVYANFGFIGIFMGIFYAVFAKLNDFIINRSFTESNKILYISIISTMYILLARGAVYNSITNAFWSIIFINIVVFLLRLRL